MSELKQRKRTINANHERVPGSSGAQLDDPSSKSRRGFTRILTTYIEPILGPILLTALAFYLRAYHIADNPKVIWDEAHFGKFGAFYNRHEFYHDVHPPLGKMLCGLSEYISGFNSTTFMFESGKAYPNGTDIKTIRLFQATFSTLVVPVCYYTCRQLGLNLWSTYFVSLTTCLQVSFIVLGKFMLLDSFLIFFMSTTFLCLARLHRLRKEEGSTRWFRWMFLTGLSIGCVCSVKWVGLFVTALVGVYTILDLWLKFWDPDNFSWINYLKSWFYRIVNLIAVPVVVYLFCFKIHFALLYKPGTGSGSMSTLFQVNLKETDFDDQPRYIALGTTATIRSQGLSPNLLHSHSQLYPDGSNQHQVTTYGFKDSNNVWEFKKARGPFQYSRYLKNGDVVRLQHLNTKSNLHSHPIRGHVSTDFYEVSGYGNEEVGDTKDDWVFEIVSQVHSSNSTYSLLHETNSSYFEDIHPVSTTFRLRHSVLGCYLATTGKAYPAWGFKQGEVVCMPAPPLDSILGKFDKSTWWNIESIENDLLPADHEYSYPKSSFFSDFLMTQHAMMASNNGLIPDDDKYDSVSSEWWEWPILRRGLRMSSWGEYQRRYYMFESPFVMWFTTICVVVYVLIVVRLLILWQMQALVVDENSAWQLAMTGIAPFLGWVFHYLPFIIMGRVTYFHHYMPALYFAVFTTAYVIDYFTHGMGKCSKSIVYFSLYATVIFFFYLFSPTCLGMTGKSADYKYLNWEKTWALSTYEPFSVKAIWDHILGDLVFARKQLELYYKKA
ncbi:DEKNAAC100163 [Brettanomyces naardenensis]|uniref:Dolichyl-phosphate-mannose--protein mannosyltransferase n=1 Tax=Brettanomyces naardenensis TaxID=13370 RepID=A0A448YEU3_BRENA|nr:DEKNAAC100163 [Brettanomyces naardenensis]